MRSPKKAATRRNCRPRARATSLPGSMVAGYVASEGMPRAWMLGYNAAMMAAVGEVGGMSWLLWSSERKSASLFTPSPRGPWPEPNAVPSSVLVPMRRGTRTKFPVESWMLG